MKLITLLSLVDTPDVVAGEGSEEAVTRVGTNKPSIIALLQNVDDVAFSKLQFVRIDGSVVIGCTIPKRWPII